MRTGGKNFLSWRNFRLYYDTSRTIKSVQTSSYMYLQYLPLPHKRDYTLTIPQELKLRTASHSSAWYPWELAHPGAARETNKHSIKIFKGAIMYMYLQGD